MKPQYYLQNIDTKLGRDTFDGNQKELLNVLKRYKIHYEDYKNKMLKHEEYEKCEYLILALDAAIRIIESKRSAKDQDHAFGSIFEPI